MHSQKVFFIFFAIFAATVLSKPFTIDVLEANDFLFPKQSELVKRTTGDEGSSNDVAELNIPKISLSSFIDNIESGLVHTALSVGGVAGDSNAQVKIVTPHSVSKRSTVEGSAAAAEGSPETVLVQTTENILASKDLPAHVVIDRVSVYKAPVAGAVLFPTFHLQETIVSGDTGEVLATVEQDQFVVETGNGANSTSTESSEESSEESFEGSSESSESSETKSTSTSTTSSGSSSSSTVADVTSTSSTTPLSVEEKQIIENNLKEKVAEVEAEPVILTARV